MPDGDRFEWRLKGKKWRTVFRLLSSSTDERLVAVEAVKGVAAYLRTNADTPFDTFIGAVHESLSSPQLPLLPPESGLSGTTGLMLRLDSIVSASQHSEAAQLAQRSAWKAFMRLDGKRDQLTREDVAAEFAGEFCCEIVERRCIGVVRDQIMKRTHRTLEEQASNEMSLQACIREAGKELGRQLHLGRSVARIQAPRRPQMHFGESELHTPLRISMEQR